MKKNRERCKLGKVMIHTELEAKIALADSQRRGKDVIRYYVCEAHGPTHWHLTSQPLRTQR